MDIRGIVKEIGYFETVRNLQYVDSRSEAVRRVLSEMPLPSESAEETISKCTEMIRKKRKKKIFFLTPEIALIEKLAEHPDGIETILIALPSDLDEEICGRIGNESDERYGYPSRSKNPFFRKSFIRKTD